LPSVDVVVLTIDHLRPDLKSLPPGVDVRPERAERRTPTTGAA
jgi:hypothetical protein